MTGMKHIIILVFSNMPWLVTHILICQSHKSKPNTPALYLLSLFKLGVHKKTWYLTSMFKTVHINTRNYLHNFKSPSTPWKNRKRNTGTMPNHVFIQWKIWCPKKNKEKEYNKTIITIYKWKCVLHISFFKQKCNWT